MTSVTDLYPVQSALAEVAREVEKKIDRLLPPVQGPEGRVIEAMRYGTLGGGKRIRPFLVVASADLFGVARTCSLRVAAAIEMVHSYSLIHDDLPCMDDDDLRRGQPTVHRKYDEATAVLAGDALLTFGFEVLSGEETHADPRVRLDLVSGLAMAVGSNGMVGGQMIDLQASGLNLDVQGITRLQHMKTGALLSYSAEAGAILGRAAQDKRLALKGYAQNLGLAFQIADDLLDIEGDEASMGKAIGKDAEAGKATLVGALGVERARLQAEMLIAQAIEHLETFGEQATLLRNIARFVINRST
ncbi:polyprenyl synthetase family protein [Govanella unica]|uniref:Polyprenyl synthetase family protein n=1 Tax=Govanella unica TaxID=2975056 RepID=A0A9X3Z7J0_9PROT|nr:farnesyl diphosphate synthase [Govania unica]MDA5194029.1 polyprenyl synthetase family protein [Govania unica]